MKIKELIEILSRYNPEMDVKLSGTVYAGIDKKARRKHTRL